eukprot:750921-Hanusia_phi.AAC.1
MTRTASAAALHCGGHRLTKPRRDRTVGSATVIGPSPGLSPCGPRPRSPEDCHDGTTRTRARRYPVLPRDATRRSLGVRSDDHP